MDVGRWAADLEARGNAIRHALWPLLLNARAVCVAVQSRPDVDEEVERVESLANADAEPIFLREEMALERLQEQINEAIGVLEEPPDAAYQLQERAGEAGGHTRDWFARKLTSITAQARAAELSPVAPGAPAQAAAQQRAVCGHCGAPISAPSMHARRCMQCQRSL